MVDYSVAAATRQVELRIGSGLPVAKAVATVLIGCSKVGGMEQLNMRAWYMLWDWQAFWDNAGGWYRCRCFFDDSGVDVAYLSRGDHAPLISGGTRDFRPACCTFVAGKFRRKSSHVLR